MSTAIEWTDKTLNPGIFGCSEVSPACAECYAAKMAHRLVAMGVYPKGITKKTAAGIHWSGKVIVDYAAIDKAFAKLPKRKPARVFVTSMSDLFHPDVPFHFIARVFDEMAKRPHLTFQALTKRAKTMAEWVEWMSAEDSGRFVWPSNVWAGCTVEDQKRADERLPWLLKVPAAVRFLSCEPLLGSLDLTAALSPRWMGSCVCQVGPLESEVVYDRNVVARCPRCNYALGGGPESPISWVISGGESGTKARPSHPQWFRDIRDQCEAADVAYLHKQNGEWLERNKGDGFGPFNSLAHHDRDRLVDHRGHVHCTVGAAGPTYVPMSRVGKKAAGRLLDGVTHDAFPEVTS